MTERTWFILGAGAIGTLLHKLCIDHDIDSCLLHHGSKTQRRVLVTDSGDAELRAHPLTSLSRGSIKRLMLTTKAAHISDAYLIATPYVDASTTVLALANGLGWETTIKEHAVARGVSTAAAFRSSAEEVSMVTAGATRVGLPSHNTPSPWFTDSLEKLPNWSWDTRIHEAIHHKFCLNCVINSLTALYRCRNGELVSNSRERRAMNSLCTELEPAMRQLGLWSMDESLFSEAVAVCEQTSGNQSSMLQDVLAGRTTENEYLGVELLRRAEKAGLALEQTRDLVRKISQM